MTMEPIQIVARRTPQGVRTEAFSAEDLFQAGYDAQRKNYTLSSIDANGVWIQKTVDLDGELLEERRNGRLVKQVLKDGNDRILVDARHLKTRTLYDQWRNPTKIIGNEKGFATGMEIIKMELGEPDDSGRRRPIAQPGTEYILDVDMIIMAIGARANPVMTKNTPGLKLNKWNYIEVNENMQTSIPDVFAGGDIVTGSATVISAMGAGKRAAANMHKYLQGNL
jgi:NADPH-dependent glutamate synthase beta subunit-like oxidoreductase